MTGQIHKEIISLPLPFCKVLMGWPPNPKEKFCYPKPLHGSKIPDLELFLKQMITTVWLYHKPI